MVSTTWILHILTQENKRCRVAYSKASSKFMTIWTQGVFIQSLLVIKYGCITISLRTLQYIAWVTKRRKPASNCKKKSISEEGTVQDIFQLKRIHVTTPPPKKKKKKIKTKQQQQQQTREEKSTTGKFCGEYVLTEVNRFYNRVRPNTGMRGVIFFHDNASAQRCMLVQEYFADENCEFCLIL